MINSSFVYNHLLDSLCAGAVQVVREIGLADSHRAADTINADFTARDQSADRSDRNL